MPRPVRLTEQSWPDGTVPVVSICCLTYNHEAFIRHAIEGFLMQETTFPVEIRITDDASTDNNAEIIREYEQAHPRLFRVIYHKVNQHSRGGRPGGETREQARGEFIAMCEGDDSWICKDKLQKQVEILESDPTVALVFHNAWVKHDESRFDYFLNGGVDGGIDKSRFTLEDVIEREWFMATASMVFRRHPPLPREILEYSLVGDIILQLGVCMLGDVVYLDEVCSIYRRHSDGMSDAYIQKKRLLHEKMRANHIWMYWMFGERAAPERARQSVERRIRKLLASIMNHALEDPDGDKPGSAKALENYMRRILMQNKPPLMDEEVLGKGGELGGMIEAESRAIFGRYRRALILAWGRRRAIQLWQAGKRLSAGKSSHGSQGVS